MEIGGVTYKWWTETRVTVAIIGCTFLGFALKWIGSGKRMSVEEAWLERRLERVYRDAEPLLIPRGSASTGSSDGSIAEVYRQLMAPELTGQFGDVGWGWRVPGTVALVAGLCLLLTTRPFRPHQIPSSWWFAMALGPLAVALFWLKYETGYRADSGEVERLAIYKSAGLTALSLFIVLRWRG